MVSSIYLFAHVLAKLCSDCVKSGKFPDLLKYANITTVYKKHDTTEKNH